MSRTSRKYKLVQTCIKIRINLNISRDSLRFLNTLLKLESVLCSDVHISFPKELFNVTIFYKIVSDERKDSTIP